MKTSRPLFLAMPYAKFRQGEVKSKPMQKLKKNTNILFTALNI